MNNPCKTLFYQIRTLREKTEALVNLANKMGGEDNISVILLKPSDEEVSDAMIGKRIGGRYEIIEVYRRRRYVTRLSSTRYYSRSGCCD